MLCQFCISLDVLVLVFDDQNLEKVTSLTSYFFVCTGVPQRPAHAFEVGNRRWTLWSGKALAYMIKMCFLSRSFLHVSRSVA